MYDLSTYFRVGVQDSCPFWQESCLFFATFPKLRTLAALFIKINSYDQIFA